MASSKTSAGLIPLAALVVAAAALLLDYHLTAGFGPISHGVAYVAAAVFVGSLVVALFRTARK